MAVPYSRVFLYSLAVTAFNVGVLYLHPRSRPSLTYERDHPKTVATRLALFSLSTLIICYVALPAIGGIENTSFGSLFYVWNDISLLRDTMTHAAKGLALVSALFIGPLVDYLIFSARWRYLYDDIYYGLSDISGWRNYLIAPLLEELVYRYAIINIHWSGISPDDRASKQTLLVFITPLYFGVAHVHHIYQNYVVANGRVPMVNLIISTLFQFLYTTVFGWLVAYLYITTGSIFTCFLVHMFCNCMGVPSLESEDGNRIQNKIYQLLLLVGPVLFWYLWAPLTN